MAELTAAMISHSMGFDASVTGDFAIRASYNGVDLGMKPIERSTARMYFQLTDDREKHAFLGSTIRKHYESEIAGIDRKASKSLSIA